MVHCSDSGVVFLGSFISALAFSTYVGTDLTIRLSGHTLVIVIIYMLLDSFRR